MIFCYIWVQDDSIFFMQTLNGVSVVVNKVTMNMSHKVEPYVTYGYVSLHLYWQFKNIHGIIMTLGPQFMEANNFMWPFKLHASSGGLKKKINHYAKGGDARHREDN
ncbi:60S ribosomal protein L7-2 [Nymphaea thermarum]|nr:60S ribosomal protein L7-2 [Nymphaea thermarum]